MATRFPSDEAEGKFILKNQRKLKRNKNIMSAHI